MRTNSKIYCTLFTVALNVYFQVINEWGKKVCETCVSFYISIYFNDKLVICGMMCVSMNETPVPNTALIGKARFATVIQEPRKS